MVPPLGRSPASASRTATRSVVGAWITRAVSLKATAPTLTRSGTFERNRPAADRAAAIRVGATSVERIDPESSVTSITVACSTPTASVAWGRARATMSAASASA